MAAIHPLDIVVVGAGMTGLTAAILLVRDGHRVTVLDRDPDPPPASAEASWTDWDRPGVSQFRQPHLMLPRWYQEISRELPELIGALLDHGALSVNLLHLQPERVTHGWQPGDEQFDTVTARRPVLEAVLGQLAQVQPGLTLRRGVRVGGLLATSGDGVPQVRGVRTSAGDVTADLVVDAAGRRTPMPGWIRAAGGPAPVEVRDPSGFVYYSRHYRARNGQQPIGSGPVLTHHPSWSVLTVPGDLGTFSVVLVTSAADHALRPLRHRRNWEAVVAACPTAAPWVEVGEPITGVIPMAGIEDIQRSYLRDEQPVVTGLVPVGDAAATTNPSLGRGATIGVLHACAIRDVLAHAWSDPREQALQLGQATVQRATPWVELSIRFDRHRLAEIDHDRRGEPYRTDDPTWPITTALFNGAGSDPLLARAASRIAGLLATPAEVLTPPDVGSRLGPFIGGPRYLLAHPTRADLLGALQTASPARSTP